MAAGRDLFFVPSAPLDRQAFLEPRLTPVHGSQKVWTNTILMRKFTISRGYVLSLLFFSMAF